MKQIIAENLKFHEHSDVLRANYKLDTNSLKLLGYNLNKLKFTDGHMVEITKNELFKILPTFKNKERLKQSLESLKTQTITGINKNLLFSVWISAVEEKEDKYLFEFPQLLLKYLRPFIANEMTNINLYHYFKLTRYADMRLYKLLSQYVDTTQLFIVKYEELKNILNLNRSREKDNMYQIKKAYENITKLTDIKINYMKKDTKNGEITNLSFFIERQKEKIEEPAVKEEKSVEKPVEIVEKKEAKKEDSRIYLDWFESIWVNYPRKEGKNRITKSKSKLKELYKDKENVEIAIKNYSEKNKNTKMKYIKQGSTFFNGDYKDYINVENENDWMNNWLDK